MSLGMIQVPDGCFWFLTRGMGELGAGVRGGALDGARAVRWQIARQP